MNAPARIGYPTKAEIARAIAAARAAGIDVSGLEVSRDGTIRLLPAAAASVATAYDRWKNGR